MTPATTSTGGFPIGFRRGRGEWQNDVAALAGWAVANGFGFIDLPGEDVVADVEALSRRGLRPGSVDLLDRGGYGTLIAPDSATRRETVARTSAHIEACCALGASTFFAVTVPADRQLSRARNFHHLVESFATLVPVLERTGSRVVVEGWPGAGAVCCTPETFRAFFREIGSDRYGVNYDPSHLVRMGIDPIRFLREFAGRVHHVHAKDATRSSEELYEYGHELPAAFTAPHGWGGTSWRYTLPGHGQTNWGEVFRVLEAAGFADMVSVELEDENFNGTAEGEQRGLIQSRDFLAAC